MLALLLCFTQEAKKYSSDISINYKDRTANAKSIVELIILGANEGSKILIEADGKDEEEAILGLIALVESDFVDPKTNNS